MIISFTIGVTNSSAVRCYLVYAFKEVPESQSCMSINFVTLFCRGYMAPEYALWGYLTHKADLYSFGVVVLELVAGKNNMKYNPDENYVCLLDWVRNHLLLLSVP